MPLPKLTRDTLARYKATIGQLNADSPRRFGAMDAANMIRHLRHTVEVSYGAKEDPEHSTWLTRGIGRIAVFHVFTRWPGGRIKEPDSWTPPAESDFETERNTLYACLDTFVDELERDPDRKTLSPLLGPRSIGYWSHLHAVHFGHHFRQFSLKFPK